MCEDGTIKAKAAYASADSTPGESVEEFLSNQGKPPGSNACGAIKTLMIRPEDSKERFGTVAKGKGFQDSAIELIRLMAGLEELHLHAVRMMAGS